MYKFRYKQISSKTLILLSISILFHINVSASDIPANTWVKITPSNTIYPPDFNGRYEARGFNSMVYRNSSQSVLFYEGYRDANDDPRGYTLYANCLYSFDLNTKTLTGLKISNWDYDNYGGDRPLPENTIDPTPANKHTYGQFAYVPSEDAVYIVGGANSRGDGDPVLDLNDTWKYSFQMKSWTKVADKLPAWEGGQLFEGNLNYVPGYNYLYFRFTSKVYKFDLSNYTWSLLSGGLTNIFGSTSTVDTKRNQIIFWGSDRYGDNIPKLLSFDPATETETIISMNPTGTQKEGGTGPVPVGKIVYHPLYDVYIMVGLHNGETWVYNPNDQTWTELDPLVPATYWDSTNTAYNFIAYDETNDLIVHFPNQSSGSTVEVFRYSQASSSDNQPPSIPTNLQATVTSADQINLSWRASTDNVGIARYKINRDGKQIGTSTVNSYSDISLSPTTQYTYTVAAYDYAGNSSGQSSAVSATTLDLKAASDCSSLATSSDPVIETMPARPPEGVWWTDPDLCGKIILLKDFSSLNGKGHHVYSDMLAFSKDNTYVALITQESGKSEQVDIYQINDKPANPVPYDLDIGIGTGTFTWATDDDDVLYYFKGAVMMKYTASTKTKSVVKDFSATFNYLQSSIQKISSNNGRYFVVGGELIVGGYGSARYDKATDTLGAVIPSAWDREVIISSDGKYLIVKTGGFPCYNAATGTFIRNLEPTGEGGTHSDIIMDSNGIQWIVYQHRNDGKVKKVSVPDGNVVALVKEPWLGYHISARHIDYPGNKDWVIVSFFTQYANQRDTTEALEDEIVRVYLDSTEPNPHYERLVKHRSEYNSGSCTDYWSQPHASVSQDGKWVIYGSDWRQPGCFLVDPYVLDLKQAGTTTPPPGDPKPPQDLMIIN